MDTAPAQRDLTTISLSKRQNLWETAIMPGGFSLLCPMLRSASMLAQDQTVW